MRIKEPVTWPIHFIGMGLCVIGGMLIGIGKLVEGLLACLVGLTALSGFLDTPPWRHP